MKNLLRPNLIKLTLTLVLIFFLPFPITRVQELIFLITGWSVWSLLFVVLLKYLIACVLIYLYRKINGDKRIAALLIFLCLILFLNYPLISQWILPENFPFQKPAQLFNDKWQTYTSEKNGFSIQLPNGWTKSELISPTFDFSGIERSDPNGYLEFNATSCRKNGCEYQKNRMRVDVSFSKNSNSLEEYTRHKEQKTIKVETSLGNKFALRYPFTATQKRKNGDLYLEGEDVITRRDDNIWRVSYIINVESDETFKNQAKNLFDQILSTFKFL